MSSTQSFPWVLELELYVEWEGHHYTWVMGKGHVWIHESGWWQLVEALLRSHRTFPLPPTPHLLDRGEALNYIRNNHEQTSAMRFPNGCGNASLAFLKVVPRVPAVCSSFSWSFRISVWGAGPSLPNFYLVLLITGGQEAVLWRGQQQRTGLIQGMLPWIFGLQIFI